MIPRPLRAALGLLLVASLWSCGREARIATAPAAPRLPPTAERAYTTLSENVEAEPAMQVVTFMQQYWRIAANPGYNASLDHIRDRLMKDGFTRDADAAFALRVDEYAGAPGWDYSEGTVRLPGESDPVLSREQDRVSLAINSFPTAAGSMEARLVDVGAATATDFSGQDVRGAVVLGDAPLGLLWREAVRNRGAAGVISTEIARYIRPPNPAEMSEEQRDVLQWGSVPYDPALKAFGFKASWRAADRLRRALARNPSQRVDVSIRSSFYEGPHRSLAAEIRGASRPDERIVVVAHLQEPGANDNASGCATLYVMAQALADAIRRGALPRPARTLTFLWVDEIRGSRQWLSSRPEDAKGVKYMFSMDMTGQDTRKTGGTFLIEKQADPSAVWSRPSDPHSEWGASPVKPETLKGSLLNDVHLAIAQRRARDTGWIVRTNPYEGGSDHTVFAAAGVPSLLNWHFTDRFYHTNQDTLDKVSPAEMVNVAVTVATSSYFLASATETDARAVVDLLRNAAVARLELERAQGATLAGAAADKAAASKTEDQVMQAWQKWYAEAIRSVEELAAQPASAKLRSLIEAAVAGVR